MAQRQAVVAVLTRAGRVLVIERGPRTERSGYWAPPSGRIEPGESQEEALVREVKEEVGLTVTPSAKVWECDTDDGTFRLHWWTAPAETGDLLLDPDEVSAARWVTPAEFLDLEPTFRGDHPFFTQVLPDLL
ncbi:MULTISPECIES: NUDIX domain-containing protein [Parafrankia]|uniref:NUDIX domain-containing protein n=1 Tax=Parafrankia TaxID=2994362 RepID=UPI000B81E6C3|nr:MULTISPECIES: NUDIX hydrolase [Parafrankia]MBE3205668.1 NUDIX hydrolase [Parafrankia sp. CH37]